MAMLSPRPSAAWRSTKYVATLKSCGIDVAEIDCSLTSVAAIAHIPPQWGRWLLLCPLRQPYARAQRRPPAQSGGDVVESARLWRAPLALGALLPEPLRLVQHRPDGLLQGLFPQDTSAESHRLRGWILRGGVLQTGRRRQRPRPARPDR